MANSATPAYITEQIEAYRLRYNVAAHVTLNMVRDSCRQCGAIVTLLGGACVCCGASGKQRGRNINSNRVVK